MRFAIKTTLNTTLLATLGLACACSLPGLRLAEYPSDGSMEGKPSTARFYDGEAVNDGQTPVITPITAALINQQRRQPHSRLSSFDILSNDTAFRAPYIYRIGIGDSLLIKVWGHPELVAEGQSEGETIGAGQIVQPDGSVYVPSVGTLQVAGLTFSQARDSITNALAATIKNPQVDVQVLTYASQFAYVVGDVERPCRLPLTHVPITILDALNQCEVVRPTQSTRQITLVRRAQEYSLDLNNLYQARNPDPLYLRHGDKLIVGDDRNSRVYLVGEFEEQLAVGIPASGLSLSDAIASAGGISLETASASKIYVIRGIGLESDTLAEQQSLAPSIFHLDAGSVDALVLANRFDLKPRDVVYAGSADLADWNRALKTMAPTLTTLFQLRILLDRR